MPEKKKGRDWRTTAAVALSCLVLGVPVGGVAINLESTFMRDVPLKQDDTISNGSHIALFAAAALTIATSAIVTLGTIILRHVSEKNVVVGLVTFGMAALNAAAQLIILALIYISNSVNDVATSPNDVKFIDGKYDANGRQFTHETWSCTMEKLFLAQEPWSRNACSEYHYARYTTIIMVVAGSLLLSIGWWPVRNYLFGRNKNAYPAKV